MNLAYHLKETGKELLRIGAITVTFCGPIVGIGYLVRNPDAERIHESNQRAAHVRADVNRDGKLSLEEFPNFLKYGGRIAIR